MKITTREIEETKDKIFSLLDELTREDAAWVINVYINLVGLKGYCRR